MLDHGTDPVGTEMLNSVGAQPFALPLGMKLVPLMVTVVLCPATHTLGVDWSEVMVGVAATAHGVIKMLGATSISEMSGHQSENASLPIGAPEATVA
jgi:hypothetical protein